MSLPDWTINSIWNLYWMVKYSLPLRNDMVDGWWVKNPTFGYGWETLPGREALLERLLLNEAKGPMGYCLNARGWKGENRGKSYLVLFGAMKIYRNKNGTENLNELTRSYISWVVMDVTGSIGLYIEWVFVYLAGLAVVLRRLVVVLEH